MTYTKNFIATYTRFWEYEADEKENGASTWYHRGANEVAAYSEGPEGATLVVEDNPDEYFVWAFLHAIKVTAGSESAEVPAGSVVIVPPGPSTVEFAEEGSLWRGFTSLATVQLAKAQNNEQYKQIPANIAPLTPWPEPVGGYKLRVYNLDELAPPGKPHCLRHRTSMTNFSWPIGSTPRPENNLSPHTHGDIEQLSLIFAGTMVNHVRRAWGRDASKWLPDEHYVVAAPAICVMQPPDEHTTAAVSNSGLVGLIDFFSPPRWDFSSVEGFVGNHDEYPMPEKEFPSFAQAEGSYDPTDPRSQMRQPGATV